MYNHISMICHFLFYTPIMHHLLLQSGILALKQELKSPAQSKPNIGHASFKETLQQTKFQQYIVFYVGQRSQIKQNILP